MARLQVGVETTCTAPLWVERLGMRTAKLAGVDSLLLPDHYIGFVPTSDLFSCSDATQVSLRPNAWVRGKRVNVRRCARV